MKPRFMRKNIMKKSILAALLIAASSLPTLAPAAEPAVSIHDAYVRLTPPGTRTTGGFMILRNAGTEDRRLIKAESPAANIVELHNHINENGVMKMREVASIAIKAHGQTELKPGGLHLMLIDLKEELKDGNTVPITLRFDDGTSQTLVAPIRKPQAAMPEHAPAHSGMGKH